MNSQPSAEPAATISEIERFVDRRSKFYLQKWRDMDLKKTLLSWNWPAFFLGPSWLAYRKMYSSAFLLFAIDSTLVLSVAILPVSADTQLAISIIIWIPIAIAVGLLANHLYRRHVDGRLAVINATKPHETDRAVAVARLGGTSLATALGVAFATLLVSSATDYLASVSRGETSGTIPLVTSSCVVDQVEVAEDSYLLNNEADYGFTAQVRIRNTGEAGPMFVAARLSSSEGMFTREREYYLNKNASETVAFQFHEPTINSQNVQVIAECNRR